MSDFKIGIFIIINLLAVFLASCGGENNPVLARGNGIEVTDNDFMNEFNRLIPEDQVGVLEPGGRLSLVNRLVNRAIFLSEVERTEIDGIEDWLEVSEDLWLARQWLEQELQSIHEAGMDTNWIDSIISIEVSMSVVLLTDSISAAAVMEDWNSNGPSEPDIEMATAPWSTGGSSYLSFHGDNLRLYSGNVSFAEDVGEYAGEGIIMMPSFGVWAVVRIDTLHYDSFEYSIPLTARSYVSTKLSRIRNVTVLSRGIDELNGHLELTDQEYSFRPGEDFDPDLIVVEYTGGVVTAGEIVKIAGLVRDESFFRGIPDEFFPYAMFRPMLDQEIDLWIYAEDIAEIKRQADLAREEGIIWPVTEAELTSTEHLLRKNVFEISTVVDTLEVIEYYNNNRAMYRIPELRSILIAYVPSEWMPACEIESFDDLEVYYIHADSAANPIPTNPYPLEMYDGFGMEVFEADSGVFTGPVECEGGDVSVFFEVVEIIPEGEENPMLILPLLMKDYRTVMVTRRLESYLLELWDSYSIEIDSSAVKMVDPWDSSY
ncbi:MAG: hypothetical protein K8S24_00790 [Candidatus Aegiribacteria sp.]|nr:hypothetical protein [Candidatus Aegiribacteria sp.]